MQHLGMRSVEDLGTIGGQEATNRIAVGIGAEMGFRGA